MWTEKERLAQPFRDALTLSRIRPPDAGDRALPRDAIELRAASTDPRTLGNADNSRSGPEHSLSAGDHKVGMLT